MECLKFLLLKPFNPRGSWTPCDRPFLRVCSCPRADVFSDGELSQMYPSPSEVTVTRGTTPDVPQHPLNSHFCKSSMCLSAWRPGPDGLCFLKVCPAVTCPLQLPFIRVWGKGRNARGDQSELLAELKNIMLELFTSDWVTIRKYP